MKPRVLFLRSGHRLAFCAPLARALTLIPWIEWMQYPPLPADLKAGLKQNYQPEQTWKDLQRNLIESPAEFQRRLEAGQVDLILLADDEAQLFRRPAQRGGRIRSWMDAWRRVRRGSWALAREHYRYEWAVPFPLSRLSDYAPVAAIENRDAACLSPRNRLILEAATVYFKRELPYDRFFMYYPDRPAPWAEWRRKLLPMMAKVHGMPLGIEDEKYNELKKKRQPVKHIDVFCSAVISNTQRQTAEIRLRSLAEKRGWTVKIAPALPFAEYCEHMARSKVTISIAGSRWECFRHYEAVALGSVPLMNRPLVDAVGWQGLPETVFFENTFENFERRLEDLLNADELRSHCLARLEERVETRLLHSRMLADIIRTALESRPEKTQPGRDG